MAAFSTLCVTSTPSKSAWRTKPLSFFCLRDFLRRSNPVEKLNRTTSGRRSFTFCISPTSNSAKSSSSSKNSFVVESFRRATPVAVGTAALFLAQGSAEALSPDLLPVLGATIVDIAFYNLIQLYLTLLTVRVLLSWFPSLEGTSPVQLLASITDPYLNLFRGLIPPLGILDLSPIVAFLLLQLLQGFYGSVIAGTSFF
mmetsp:Transcript_375/g.796  ORF Transcript_375/g.796 Transcript_375/m.796 type:complete len:199 (-) Transcript_375:620-1216(-)